MENSPLPAQHHEAQSYFTESEIFIFNMWLSLWVEHGDREWKGIALSEFGWMSYGAAVRVPGRPGMDGLE